VVQDDAEVDPGLPVARHVLVPLGIVLPMGDVLARLKLHELQNPIFRNYLIKA
jgi:hypothetical protein